MNTRNIKLNRLTKITFALIALISLVTFIRTDCAAQHVTDSVIVLPLKMMPPANAQKIGTIKVGNNATKTACDYEEVVTEAKEKAVKMGGNIVKITSLVAPAFISRCYSIKADVYAATPLPNYDIPNERQNKTSDTVAGYALLYLYRLKDTLALEPSYNLHLGKDTIIGKAKSKWSKELRIYKTGEITLWATTNHQTNLKLNVKAGEIYYIRCGLRHGELIMEPVIEVVNNITGAEEYNRLNKGKKSTMGGDTADVKYLQQIH